MEQEPITSDTAPAGAASLRYAIYGLLILSTLVLTYVARSLLQPIVIALLFAYALSPLVRSLRRIHVPEPLSAFLIMGVILSALGLAGFYLSEPAEDMVRRAPARLDAFHDRVLAPMQSAFHQVSEASKKIDGESDADDGAVRVKQVDEDEGIQATVMAATPRVIGSVFSTVILLYFFLAFKSILLLKLVHAAPHLAEKRRVVKVERAIESGISRYLLTITTINAVLGLAIGAVLRMLEFPDPWVWGAAAALLNFMPYVGAMLGVGAMAITAVVIGDSLSHVWYVYPLAYFALTLLEGNIVTPLILGRSFMVNPVFVILALLFWGWMWGVVGALLSVPFLVTAMIVFREFPSMKPLYVVLSRDRENALSSEHASAESAAAS